MSCCWFYCAAAHHVYIIFNNIILLRPFKEDKCFNKKNPLIWFNLFFFFIAIWRDMSLIILFVRLDVFNYDFFS